MPETSRVTCKLAGGVHLGGVGLRNGKHRGPISENSQRIPVCAFYHLLSSAAGGNESYSYYPFAK